MSSAPAQLQDLVDALAAGTGAPATLEDRDLNLVASSGHDGVIDDVRRSSILRRRSDAAVQTSFAAFGIARAEQPLRIPGEVAAGRLSRWCLPVRWQGATYGYLWLLDPDEQVPQEALLLFSDLVEQVAMAMALRTRTSDRATWATGELLADDAVLRARGREQLRHDGLLPDGPVVVAALAARDGGPLGPLNSWLLPRAVLSAGMGQRAALVLPAADLLAATNVVQRTAQSLAAQREGGVAAGLSGPVAVAGGYDGWRQAEAALRAALHPAVTAAQASVEVRSWAGLGVLRLLALADASLLSDTVTDEGARRLLAGHPDLLLTARTYFEQAGSAQRTAAALAIHRQTLYARLRRIEEVCGYDLADGSDRLALHLALTLWVPKG